MVAPLKAKAKTIGEIVAWARQCLDQAGIENAAQEALWLSAQALEIESHQLASRAEQSVSPELEARAVSLITRRAAHEPLQYILGTQEFCGLEFDVSPAVLIPRPETEFLVQEALRGITPNREALLVDVGTGSGCVAVTLATVLNGTRVIAIDRCPEVLAVAKRNADKHSVGERIEWVEGDLLSPLRDRGLARTVQVIVSNPPYIAESDWAGMQPEIRLFEPRLALVSGKTGTEFHERLLREARDFLVPDGLLVMEIGQGQTAAVQEIAKLVGSYAALEMVKDEAGIERVVIARRLE